MTGTRYQVLLINTRIDIILPFLLVLIQVFGANTEVGKTVITAGLLRAAAPNVRDMMRRSHIGPFPTATTLGILANNTSSRVYFLWTCSTWRTHAVQVDHTPVVSSEQYKCTTVRCFVESPGKTAAMLQTLHRLSSGHTMLKQAMPCWWHSRDLTIDSTVTLLTAP